MEFPLPRTARLRLRHLVPDDVERFVVLNADERVMTYLDREPPSPDAVRHEVQELIESRERWPHHGRFVAESPDGEFFGWFGLMVRNDDPSTPNLGYRLRRRVWGAGLATEGSLALIDHAFAHLGAARVEAETMFVNHASRRVMEKCGMSHVETFHVHFDDPLPGTEFGEVRYAITRREWALSRRPQAT